MQFGVAVPNYRRMASRDNLLMVAHRSEELGLDSLWLTDHVVVPRSRAEMFGEDVYEPLAVMAFLAGQTSRVQLGTAILVIPYRNPVVVAKLLGTIDVLSNGRVVLGTGSGWMEEEFRALGVPYADRGPMTDEYLQAIHELWTSDDPRYEGKFVRFRDIHAGPRPVQKPRPPIIVGGYSRKAIRRAVALGDGWFPEGMSLADLEKGIAYLRQAARDMGRDPSTLRVYLRSSLWLSEVSGAGSGVDAGLPSPWAQSKDFADGSARLPFQGTIAEVIEDIRAAESLGVGHLIFESPVQRGDERFDMIEAFASEVLPAVRSVSAGT